MPTLADKYDVFIQKEKANPISGKEVVIGKDLSFPDQTNPNAFVLLLPLAVEDLYAYIQPYIDQKTKLVKYVLKVAVLKELSKVVDDDKLVYLFHSPDLRNTELIRFAKGARYCVYLAKYFSEKSSKRLYKSIANPNIVIPNAKFHDSSKVEYQQNGGYVEIVHQREDSADGQYAFALIKCVKSQSGEMLPPKVFVLLNEEWSYFNRFLEFCCRTFQIVEGEGSLEMERVQSAYSDLQSVLKKKKEKRKAIEGSCSSQDVSVGETSPAPPPRRKQKPKIDIGVGENNIASNVFAAVKSTQNRKKKIEGQQATNTEKGSRLSDNDDVGDIVEENSQELYYSSKY